jgi:DNA-binding MarR family transcriptional regulator
VSGKLRKGGFLIAKIHQVSGRIFNRLLKEYGIGDINTGQGRILFALWQEDNIPISGLAAKTQLEKSTLTAMLDRLEKEGLVRRVPSGEDRRKIIIRGTEKNRGLEKKYLGVSREMTSIFYRGMKESAIDELELGLERILDNLIREETGRV